MKGQESFLDKTSKYAHLALFSVGVIYALNYFIAKGLMPDKIGPSGFIALRVVGGGLLFWGVRFLSKIEKVDRGDLLRLALCGLTGVAINQLCFFNGLSLTSPLHASLIMTINPIFVLVASALILGSSITTRKLLGIALGGAGAILLLLSTNSSPSTNGPNLIGDILILINALSYGVYLVVVKPLMQRYRPITVISWAFLFGALFAIPFGVNDVLEIQWNSFSFRDWQSVFYVVIGTTFLAYLLNIYALGTVEPTVVSIYIYLQPIIVTVLSAVWAYGDLNLNTLGCAGMIFSGVWLVSIPKGYLTIRN